MKHLSKLTTVDTNKIQPEKLIHMYFVLYSMTYIHGFT